MRKTLIPVLMALALAASCSTHTAPAQAETPSVGADRTISAPVTLPDKATLPVMPTLPTVAAPTTTTGDATATTRATPSAPTTPAPATTKAAASNGVWQDALDAAAPVVVYVAVTGRANVRKAPSTSSAIVGTLARGAAVTAVPVSGGTWYLIAEGRFIAASVVSDTKPKPLPAAPTATGTTRTQAPKSQAVAPQTRFNACIDQVDPGRTAQWFYKSKGPWGQTLVPVEEVYVSPAVPAQYVCDVVRHEWIHVLQSRAWGLDLFDETNRILGTTGQLPVDQVADCGAQLLGAKWVHYGCKSAAERNLAADLLAGRF